MRNSKIQTSWLQEPILTRTAASPVRHLPSQREAQARQRNGSTCSLAVTVQQIQHLLLKMQDGVFFYKTFRNENVITIATMH